MFSVRYIVTAITFRALAAAVLLSGCSLKAEIEVDETKLGSVKSLAPTSPTSLILQSPSTSAGTDTTPTITVNGVTAGDTVKLFTNNTCTSEVANGVAVGTSILLTSSVLADGSYTFYSTTQNSSGTSLCSIASVSYVVDNTAPNPITSVTLSSDSMGGNHTSVSTSPDLIIVAPGTDSGSGVSKFEYQIIKTSDSSTVIAWTEFGAGVSTTTQVTGLSLTNTVTYKFSIRVKDLAGNTSTAVDSSPFTIQAVTANPYTGLGLPDPTTLSDGTLSGSIDGSVYTRTNPYQGKTLTVNGAINWSNRAAVFLRADTLNLNSAVISGNGADGTSWTAAYVPGNGGAGGSGGGGGIYTYYGGAFYGGNGGSGANGTNGSSTGASNQPGTGGAGTGSIYSVGFTYGTGGNGGAGGAEGNASYGGTAGSGQNGAGGGGGGAGTDGGGGWGTGAGGGGGGLVVIVANTISGTGSVFARGGDGGGPYVSSMRGGGGGGGVIWIAAKNYQGNLGYNVNGGTGYINGSNGTAKIFQINADGSLTERNFADSWSESGAFSPGVLPMTLVGVSSLSDGSLTNTTISAATYTRNSPYSANNLTVTGTLSPTASTPTAIFLRANNLILSDAVISANGSDGTATVGANAGDGGSGGSGGGGGIYTYYGAVVNIGGDGGSGGAAKGGDAFGSSFDSGLPGLGFAKSYASGFNFGNGGSGGTGGARGGSTYAGSGGAGINGGGGGGGGGGTDATGGGWSTGGGGGGGGLIVIVANSISGNGQLQALGGSGGGPFLSGRHGGGGGGGVIWIATKSYSGNLSYNVNGGTGFNDGTVGSAKIFQINPDGTLTERTFVDSWDASGNFTSGFLPVTLTGVTSLSDGTLNNTTLSGLTYTQGAPYSAKDLTISGSLSPTPGTKHALFIRANSINFSAATVSSAGSDGTACTAAYVPGVGGTGAGGGGGGVYTYYGGATYLGGKGGSGRSGFDAESTGSSNASGAGAAGGGFSFAGGFDFGTGGNGGGGHGRGGASYGGTGGAGSNGSGGGGGGGGTDATGGGWGSGGGGGGGGLIVIVANSITGTATLDVHGGSGGGSAGSNGGGGGGGVIWIATKSYTGGLTVNVNGGTGYVSGSSGSAKIFKINSDGTLVLKTFSDTW